MSDDELFRRIFPITDLRAWGSPERDTLAEQFLDSCRDHAEIYAITGDPNDIPPDDLVRCLSQVVLIRALEENPGDDVSQTLAAALLKAAAVHLTEEHARVFAAAVEALARPSPAPRTPNPKGPSNG